MFNFFLDHHLLYPRLLLAHCHQRLVLVVVLGRRHRYCIVFEPTAAVLTKIYTKPEFPQMELYLNPCHVPLHCPYTQCLGCTHFPHFLHLVCLALMCAMSYFHEVHCLTAFVFARPSTFLNETNSFPGYEPCVPSVKWSHRSVVLHPTNSQHY